MKFHKHPPGEFWSHQFWCFCSRLVRMYLRTFYRYRLFQPEGLPQSGPVIYASNHQSHLDPPAAGLQVCQRRFRSLARASLFRVPILGWIIHGLGAVPLARGAGDMAAFKVALGVLKEGNSILLFPEGTRTRDGALGEFKRGVILLQKHSKATVVPLAVEGAFDVWPYGQLLPRLTGRIVSMAGTPIPYDELEAIGPDAMLEKLKREIETMRLQLRAELHRVTDGKYPAPGPADRPYWEQEESD